MKNRRGFTLIEMMVVVGVSALLVLAIAAAATQFASQTQGDTRRSEAEARIALSLSLLDKTLANAGVGFADSRYAYRIYNNLDAGSAQLKVSGGGNLPVVARGSSGAGVLEGTDVIDVAFSENSVRRAGVVRSLILNGDGTASVLLATNDPLIDGEIADLINNPGVEGGPLLLFTNERGRACIGRAKNAVGVSTPQLTIQFKTDDLADLTADPTAKFDGGDETCPQLFDSVFALEQRRRYMVWQNADGGELGLYSMDAQQSPAPGVVGAPPASSGIFPSATPSLMALGIDNMQVSAYLQEDTGPSLGCDAGVCECNGSPTACSLTDADLVGGTERRSNVRMSRIELVAQGNRQEADAPAISSMDGPAPPTDRIRRVRASTTVTLFNMFLASQ